MKIREGDKVAVNFNNGQYTLTSNGIVRYMPRATGDSWIIEDAKTGDIHYISEGCTITKKKENKS